MRGIHKNPRHTFMFLTKRPIRMREILSPPSFMVEGKPLPNLWLGVTVCNQQEADEKIPLLLQTPAAKRFVSVEPMLAEISFRWKSYFEAKGESYDARLNRIGGKVYHLESLKELDWCIVGGETGPGARPMHPDWVRSLRDQCKEAGVPFFFKQMSGRAPIPDDLLIQEIPNV
jgi:protein gp37